MQFLSPGESQPSPRVGVLEGGEAFTEAGQRFVAGESSRTPGEPIADQFDPPSACQETGVSPGQLVGEQVDRRLGQLA